MILCGLAATSYWTSEHVLIILNVVLAASAVATAIVGLKTIKSSNRVAAAAEAQGQIMQEELAVTNDQLELDRQALQSSVKPLLVAALNQYGEASFDCVVTDDGTRVGLTLTNIGQGPAIVHSALLTLGPARVWEADSEHKVVPRDSLVRVSGSLPDRGELERAIRDQRLGIGVKYSDISSGQRTQSTVFLGNSLESPRIHRIEIHHCDDNWVRADLQVASGVGAP
jgi:hypothetical protein